MGSTEVTAYERILYVEISDPGSPMVGQEVALTATPNTGYGPVTADLPTQWISSNPAVASISADGRLRALSLGFTTIEARIGEDYGSRRVTVEVAPVASITMSPATATIVPFGAVSLLAEPRDASGTVTSATVTWTSSNPTIAAVSASGRVVANGTPGSTTITASSNGKSGTAVVTVAAPGAPVRIVVSPGPTYAIPIGQGAGFAVVAYDAIGGQVQFSGTVSWTSSAPSVATVSAAGQVSGLAAGTTTITATSGTMTASTAVTVYRTGTIGSFRIIPASGSLLLGQQKQLVVQLLDPSGNQMTVPTITWTSSAPSVATVTAAGLLTAVGKGAATITAAIPGATATTSFTMGQPAVFDVKVSPSAPVGVVGETMQLTATVTDNAPNVLTDRVVTWSSSNPAMVSVSETGLVTLRAVGGALVSASAEGITTSVSVSVVAALTPVARVVVTPARTMIPGWLTQPTPLAAVAYNAAGGVITGRPVTWRSTNTAILTVNATGGVIPVAPGDAEVVATMDGVSGSSWISVEQKVVDHFELIGPTTLTVGQTVPFDIVLYDAGSNIMSTAGRTFTWSSTNPAVLAVTPTGVATAVAIGGAEIRVSVDGLVGSVYVRVAESQDVVSSVWLGRHGTHPSMLVGDSLGLVAWYTTVNGQGGTYGLTWTSSNPAVATATPGLWNGNPTGIIQGRGVGSTLITASIGGKSDTITVAVTNPVPVASLTVTPNPLTLGVNGTAQLVATARDASGNVLNGRLVTWTVANSGVATVGTEGFTVGRAVGTTTITATCEGKLVTVPVTVLTSPPAIASISVTPTPVSISTGMTIQLTATARDATGTVLPGRVFTWSSGNSSVAGVGAGGLVSGLSAGTATISASSGGVSGSGAVTVTTASGGTGGGSVCSSNIEVATPALGTNTGWIRSKFSGIDFMITAFTGNLGTATSPSYSYQVAFRNRYTQAIWFSARGPSVDKPADTQYAKSLGAGATGATNSNSYNKPATLWVYIAFVRLGSSTATPICE